MESSSAKKIAEILALADVQLQGSRPWDIQIRNPEALNSVLAKGSLGMGESYMEGWWDCERLDQFFHRILGARLDREVVSPGLLLAVTKAKLLNLQSIARSKKAVSYHYDLGNDLYEAMLDPNMAYSCGYWNDAETLEQAQSAKLDLICQKLALKPGMKLLDIGCGWGSLMRFAALNYGVECVGLTLSKEQAKLGKERTQGLPVSFELLDYRDFNTSGEIKFDRIVSIEMFEHVGQKNYPAYFQMARRCLKEDGLFLFQTIGKNDPREINDPWIEKYIFPDGVMGSISEIAKSVEPEFIIEDLHNFGADYDRTFMEWHANFEAAWPTLQSKYDEKFYRMWRYYLLCCAGTFRVRGAQIWQFILSPKGCVGGYQRPVPPPRTETP